MKTIITLLTTVVGLLALPNTAEAGHGHSGSSYTYRSGHASCGCAIYTKRIISGYDCYHRPIYRYYSVPIAHSCHSKRSHYQSRHRSHYGHYNKYSHRSRHYSPFGHRYNGNRFSFRGGFGSVRTCR